jgi:hypothetical protein
MLTKDSRKDTATKVPEDRTFREQPAPDEDGDAGHVDPLNFDHSPSASYDPYNTTGRFTLDDDQARTYPAVPDVPKVVLRR